MSSDIKGGMNYALMKRHYDADDYPSLIVGGVAVLNGIPFTATPDYYIVGTMAYLNDSTVADIERGWTLFTHGQPAAPTWLAPFLATLGVAWPVSTPAFEAKDLLFWADQDCWLQFVSSNRARQYIPATTYMRFHRRCFMFFVTRDTVDGTLRAWIEG